MKPRAIVDLDQLTDAQFFEEIGRGMSAVLANASAFVADAELLAESDRGRSRDLVLAVAEEEAAKFHILLDAVRTPRPGPLLARQLRRFNEHLAKGIYANYARMRPATFGEVLRIIESSRQEFYLDGPNDVDWIFRNRILQGREEAMYVDYVETDDGHQWLEPHPLPMFFRFNPPAAVSLAVLMHEAGFTSPGALACIASEWRGITFAPDDHWRSCRAKNWHVLNVLNNAGLLTDGGAARAGELADRWSFPIWDADLSIIKVSRQDLRAKQAAWTPY